MLTAGEIAGLKNDLRDFYNNFPKYTTIGSFYQITKLSSDSKYIKYIMKYIEPDMKVLDLGMGSGIITMEIARIAREVIGVDIASRIVDFAAALKNIEIKRYKLIEDFKRKNYNTSNIENVSYQVDDAENLSFKDNTFDLIISQDVIEHLPAPIRAINHMLRCLKPRGRLILVLHTPIIDTNLNIDSWKKDISKMKNKDAVSKMNYNVLQTWFKRNKIKIIEYEIIYNSKFVNNITNTFKFYKGAKFLEQYEDTIILVIEK
ncbi:MAG: class I SAM-dependent methyltransferase [Cyanobacteriota bacterium]